MLAVFFLAYLLPFEALPAGGSRVSAAGREALLMLQDYARHHVILCLVPALFIAGAISCFVSQASVMKYLGPTANKLLAYSVASVTGTILAVCSCTVLPLFAGIWTRGAGLGPAVAFLYSGPAINVLAIILTARILGWELGAARALAAIGFSFIVGLVMYLIYRREERAKAEAATSAGGFVLPEDATDRPLWQTASYFAVMICILVFANWARPATPNPLWAAVFAVKWIITGVLCVVLAVMIVRWFTRDELKQWVGSTWFFTKKILPLLFIGVLVSGVLLGRPGHEALLPGRWIEQSVGGNGLGANLFASVAGALMYFATLTEVPILQGLLGSGMGKGPALALLLAGPALSLPSMLVIRSVVGTQKMLVYVSLVTALSTVAGLLYGTFG
ncbi:MAG: permease [Planctomycetota bacterium]